MTDPGALVLADLRGALPPRRGDSHKGDYGHVLVIGGNHGMAGAARMAAEAAARLGAGLVSVATRASHAPFLGVTRPELMVQGVETADEVAPLLARATVVVLGPGLGLDGWARDLFEVAFAAGLPMVVDADALNLLAASPRRPDAPAILSPHPGEAGRLLGTRAADVQADRAAAVSALREAFGGVWVLKGAGSLVASDEGLDRCGHGHPAMASGGMGDVLSGMFGALLAQGLSAARAARLGVCLHGAAGEAAASAEGGRGMLALDLLPHARRLLEEISPC
ncbi:MAG: NAD(P)H-hydrate dehydratase [Pseudomonadota bacterium]